MKILFTLLTVFFISLTLCGQQISDTRIDSNFKVSYISVGLGANMWEMQPVFNAQGSQFIYTSEEVWESENIKKSKPDTLCVGNLRKSSIDSILNIITEVKADSVYKLSSGITDGGIIYLEILSNGRKLNFRLDNAFDLTAKKIIDILNSNIPDRYPKLGICNFIPDIIKII